MVDANPAGCADFLSFNAYMATTVADGTFAARPSHGTIDSDRDAIVVGADNTPGHFGNAFAQVRALQHSHLSWKGNQSAG